MSDCALQVRHLLERGKILEAVAVVDGVEVLEKHRCLQHAELQARSLDLEHAAELFAIKRALLVLRTPDSWQESCVLVPVVLGSRARSWPAEIQSGLAHDGPSALIASRHFLLGIYSAMLGDLDRAVASLQHAARAGRDAIGQNGLPLAFSLSAAAHLLACCRLDNGDDPTAALGDMAALAAQPRLELQIEARLMRTEYSAARAAMTELEQLPLDTSSQERLDYWKTFEAIAVGRWASVVEQLSTRYSGDLRIQLLQALQIQYGALLHRHQPSTRELLEATYADIQPLQLHRKDWQSAHELRRWLAALQHDFVLRKIGTRVANVGLWRADGCNARSIVEAIELARHAATPSIRVLARLVVQMARAAGFLPSMQLPDDDVETLCSDLVDQGLLVEALACVQLMASPQADAVKGLCLRIASLQHGNDRMAYLLNNSTEHDRIQNAALVAHSNWLNKFWLRRWPVPAWICLLYTSDAADE